MNSTMRRLCLLLGLAASASGVFGEAALPSIFVSPPMDSPPAPNFGMTAPPRLAAYPLSAVTKQHVTASVLNDPRLTHATVSSQSEGSGSKSPATAAGDVVTMERYIVRAERAPTVLLPVGPEHPFLDAIKSGRLYRHVGKHTVSEANFWASNKDAPYDASPVAATNTPRVTRVELAYRLSW